MASQISHVIYAKRYFEKHPSTMNKDEFILGCVFPDIRRIDKNVKRSQTHMHFPDVKLDFEGLTSFEAGWKFHAYCDMKREEILNRYGFYSVKGSGEFEGVVSKILEDKLVYHEYNNWEKLQNYFNNVPQINFSVPISRETFGLWYAILAKYFEKEPDEKSIRAFLAKQPSLASHVDEIMSAVGKLEKNKKAVEILGRVKEEVV